MDSPANLIVAITGGLVGITGYINTRQGRRDTKAQQQAANRLAEREQQWEERGEIIADLRTELDRLQTVAERARIAEETTRDELDEARRNHAADRREWARREAALLEENGGLRRDFDTLRAVVVQQINDAADGHPPTSPPTIEEQT